MSTNLSFRNMYYKGTLAAKRGFQLGDCPKSLSGYEKCAWLQGFNAQSDIIKKEEKELEALKSLM